MQIERLLLKNFRNYKEENICFSPGVNMIYGDNGQGKTNIAEAIYLFSTARSHRTAKERDMIPFGQKEANITLFFKTKKRDMKANFRIFQEHAHEISINDVQKIKNSELIGCFQAVMFSPEDFSFIKEGPSERRKFMDIAISQIRPQYFKKLSEYNRYLKSKMKALKQPEYFPMLDVYNHKISDIAADIILYRQEFIQRIAPKINQINQQITKTEDILEVEYESCIPFSNDKNKMHHELVQKLEKSKDREIKEKACLIGPHREDLKFYLNEQSLKDFGSQGQMRTAVLAVKMAQAEIILQDFGEYPVLILDDILSELDATRRKYLLNEIRGKQVIITGTDKANFGKRKDTKLMKVVNGKIIE